MIISHKYKFIFIKTLKTAGTSMEVFLSQHCARDDVVTPIWPPVEPHYARNHEGYWNPIPELIENRGHRIKRTFNDLSNKRKFYRHMPARILRRRIPSSVWNSYFKFCVERNPWDKTLSDYHMRKDRSGREMSLDEYLERGRFCINYPKYCDRDGRMLVDRVIKYESLLEGAGQVFHDLGVPFDGTLGVKAKSGHRKDRRPYQEVLSDRQRVLIERAFSKEISMHGYRF